MFWGEVDRKGESFINEVVLKLIEFAGRGRNLREGWKAALGRKTKMSYGRVAPHYIL